MLRKIDNAELKFTAKIQHESDAGKTTFYQDDVKWIFDVASWAFYILYLIWDHLEFGFILYYQNQR